MRFARLHRKTAGGCKFAPRSCTSLALRMRAAPVGVVSFSTTPRADILNPEQSPLGPMARAAVPAPHAEFTTLSKVELRALADGLLQPEPWLVERCVHFVIAETEGVWHGRARAMMCRRLKHCGLGRAHRDLLVECITRRLSEGSFAEQFKDQLRLAMHIDFAATVGVSHKCVASKKPYVRRYAEWVLSHEARGCFP